MQVLISVAGLISPFIATIALVSAATGYFYQDASHPIFVYCGVFFIVLWLILRFAESRGNISLPTTQDGAAVGVRVVVYAWLTACAFAAAPLILLTDLGLSVPEALFEAVSGITTTGATVFADLDSLDKSVLIYRQFMQWIGGLGLVVALVALMPRLGQVASRLFRTELTGTQKDARVEVRIQKTAMAFLWVYLGLTFASAVCYYLAGMAPFDSVAYALSTVAIGGFAPHTASIGHFNSTAIELMAVVFMLLSSINFAAHYVAATQVFKGGLHAYIDDPELRYFFGFLLAGWVLVSVLAYSENPLFIGTDGSGSSISWWRAVGFQTVSIITTTGFTNTPFAEMGHALPIIWISLAIIGGCANTPTGGIRTMRIMAMLATMMSQIRQINHPHALTTLRLGMKVRISERLMLAICAYLATYIMVFCVSLVVLVLLERDLTTAYGATMACLNNLGPGLGKAAQHYGELTQGSKLALSFLMLTGRLEIFAVLALFTAGFHASHRKNQPLHSLKQLKSHD